ncbi:MAG: hypothetical protein WEB88_03350 [Gemmatimonadota bacterium]
MSVVALLLLLGTPPGAPFQATFAEAALVRSAPPTPVSLASIFPAFISPASAQAPSDPWFGQDKVRHALHAYAAVAFGHAMGTAAGLEADAARGGAVVAAAALGVAKEVADRRRGGSFSVRDLVWDALGIGVGALVMGGAGGGGTGGGGTGGG